MYVSADIQYFAVSNRVYLLTSNVGIHFLFTYYFPIRSFRLVPMFSGNTPIHINSPGTLHLMQSEEQWNGHWLSMDSVVNDL
jgi:hypothetical protein